MGASREEFWKLLNQATTGATLEFFYVFLAVANQLQS